MTNTLQTRCVAESSGGRDEEQPNSVCDRRQSFNFPTTRNERSSAALIYSTLSVARRIRR